MTVEKEMEKLIRQYGNEMTLVRGKNSYTIRAFLQAARSKSMENAQRVFSPMGEGYAGRFVYIGPTDPMAKEGDLLEFQGRTFEVRRSEPVRVQDAALYCWGLCVERGGDGAWGA